MKLKEGQRIKLINKDGLGRNKGSVEHQGVILKIYSNYILLDLKKYMTCINLADIINPYQNSLKVRCDKEWINVTKEMLEVGVIS